MNKWKVVLAAVIFAALAGCASVETKREAFPLMYDEDYKPLSILVAPAINKSTAADAGELINVTLTQPLADNGFYVVPIAIVSEIFQSEGIVAGEQLLAAPMSVFSENFGADAVLFVTINEWDKNYYVVGGNVTVGMSFVLLSTKDREVVWSYDAQVVLNTAGQSSGSLLVDLISTAVNTAIADYIPIARQVNSIAISTLPFGQYHPRTGQDGEANVVLTASKDEALKND
jgi:hypothetical protein